MYIYIYIYIYIYLHILYVHIYICVCIPYLHCRNFVIANMYHNYSTLCRAHFCLSHATVWWWEVMYMWQYCATTPTVQWNYYTLGVKLQIHTTHGQVRDSVIRIKSTIRVITTQTPKRSLPSVSSLVLYTKENFIEERRLWYKMFFPATHGNG